MVLVRSKIVGVRFTAEEVQRLLLLADRCGRTPSDVLRQLVRRVAPEQLSNGIPPALALDRAVPEPEPAR